MAKRRELGNPLALTVMVLLAERSMHPYEIARTLRRRGRQHSVKINPGSLHTVVQNLEKHGHVEVSGVRRQGNRPERTLNGITETGRAGMLEWLSGLIAVPAAEFPDFDTAPSPLPVLPADTTSCATPTGSAGPSGWSPGSPAPARSPPAARTGCSRAAHMAVPRSVDRGTAEPDSARTRPTRRSPRVPPVRSTRA